MKKLSVFILSLFAAAVSLAGSSYPDPSTFAVMGDYQGKIEPMPKKGKWKGDPLLAAQVINIDETTYRVVLLPELNKRCPAYYDVKVQGTHERLEHEGDTWKFVIADGKISGSTKDGDDWVSFSIEKANRVSPTMGKKAPKGAVVLMDGSSLDAWTHGKGEACTWKLTGDGAMEVEPKKENKSAKGAIFTKQKFASMKLHLEFRYPVEPGKSGQGRGNSGVFLMCPLGTNNGFETQILNSYGLEGYWNECGALYKVMAPKVNAAAAPLVWQTYDIDFKAPQFDESGKMVANARITVLHNGILIHKNQELPYLTAHKQETRWTVSPASEPQPIQLQDHSNRIQYRNIWVLPQ